MNLNDIAQDFLFFGAFLSLTGYFIGMYLKQKLRLAIFNPLLVAVIFCILFLLGTHISYETYNIGARYVSYLLTPATICLAIPLYEQLQLLKENWKAILLGIFSGVITSCICVLGLCLLFHLDHTTYVTLLPKSITTAIGMGVSEELGGYVTITVSVIVLTGIVGNLIATMVCRIFRIHHPIAKGIGIGCAAHAIGTTKAMEMGLVEGAMSSLSIAVAGILTVIAAPFFALIL